MPASFGVQGPGESTIASGFAARVSSDADLVVPPHRHVRAEFAEIVDEVEREAVIVVDQGDALHSFSDRVERVFSDAAPQPSSRTGARQFSSEFACTAARAGRRGRLADRRKHRYRTGAAACPELYALARSAAFARTRLAPDWSGLGLTRPLARGGGAEGGFRGEMRRRASRRSSVPRSRGSQPAPPRSCRCRRDSGPAARQTGSGRRRRSRARRLR